MKYHRSTYAMLVICLLSLVIFFQPAPANAGGGIIVVNTVDLVYHEICSERLLEEVGKPVWDRFGRHLENLGEFDTPARRRCL